MIRRGTRDNLSCLLLRVPGRRSILKDAFRFDARRGTGCWWRPNVILWDNLYRRHGELETEDKIMRIHVRWEQVAMMILARGNY